MSLSVQVDVLRHVPIFSGVGDEELAAVAMSSEPKSFAAGQTIFQSGAQAPAAYVVLSGVAAQVEALAGDADRTRFLTPATLVGEMALFTDTTYNVTVQAGTDVEVLGFTHERFRRVLTEFPAIAQSCRDRLAGRLSALSSGFEAAEQELSRNLPTY